MFWRTFVISVALFFLITINFSHSLDAMINTNIQYGDYAELIKNIPDKSIDLLLTDPPYEHIKGGCRDKEHWNKNGVYSGTSFMNTDLSSFGKNEVFDFLNNIEPKMKKMNAYIFCSRLQLTHYFAWISEHKYKYDLLFWNKATEGGYMVRTTKVFTNDIEYVIRLYEPHVGLNRIEKEDGTLDSKFYLKNQTVAKVKGDHETTKPLELLNKYIKLSSNEGDVVLDPFMGSGSTGVSCVLNGRNFIGFEKEKVYFDMAQRRIADSKFELKIKEDALMALKSCEQNGNQNITFEELNSEIKAYREKQKI